ncbi:hypothetical protein HGRIS_010233 [Hohenbuehelia grisea]|uniref:Fungal N-terminal domain-containing protein n=1 Tax=Hohenbuehelia grisea TaxID=104357 RepID=A0ABR3J3P1_9AGAR
MFQQDEEALHSTHSPREPPRSMTFNVLSGINTVVDPMWSNPSLQSAIQVLGQLADLGKTLPFVAPAFILLKIIVDVENGAREVDVKCNDLLERITFMLSHLPLLETLTITDATRAVIDRINVVLKQAAALIEAYRKQGKVARRLTLGNKEKFATCALSVNSCINDLMMSLQIHQTSQLDTILSRSVPSDPEDEAAQAFITTYGGDVVRESPQLVTQFAEELHLRVDDGIMEQLNVNLSEVIQEKQVELEKTINDNVGAAILSSLQGIAAQMNEMEKEQKFICVQCSLQYTQSTNGPSSCNFHKAEMSGRSFPCCGSQTPCQFRFHRHKHHSEYPYSSFFKRAWGIINYTDTLEKWSETEDVNLETNSTQKAHVGRLLRWASRSDRVQEPTILLRLGRIWWADHYYFDTFTAQELESVSQVVNITHQTTIFRTSPSEDEYALAEWVLSSAGVINGIRLTAKAATSEKPFVHVVPFDIATCTKTGDVVTVSEGGIRAYTPRTPYTIPETARVSAELSDKPIRAPRTDFKTVTTLPLVIKPASVLTANPDFARRDADYFVGSISIINKASVNGGEPITLTSASASFRLVGDDSYTPVTTLKLISDHLPATIEPRQSITVPFQVEVPRSEADTALSVQWWNRAFIARERPLRLKVAVQDIEGEEASLVMEYVFTPFSLTSPKPEDLAFFSFDNPDQWERAYITVTKPSYESNVVAIDGTDVEVKQLKQAVWSALKSGNGEVELTAVRERAGGSWEWRSWALVDLNCRRVYAFKILITQGSEIKEKKFACLGYVACPEYDDAVAETRVIQYATETAGMPELPPVTTTEVVTDDDVDDYVPPPPPKPLPALPGAEASAGGAMALPSEVTARLTSIDTNLERIAGSLERLVEMLAKTSTLNGRAH